MSDEDALLAAIRESPDDDTLRLVLADWYDDHGQAERAEFIRLHLTVARSDEGDVRRAAWLARLHRLHAAHGAGWAGYNRLDRSGWHGWRWGRGLVESVTLSDVAILPTLLDRHPIREVV